MGFEMPTTGGGSKYVWYYDTVFEVPTEKAETQKNKPTIQEIEISFKCYKNKKLDTHKAELDMNGKAANIAKANKWFTEVPTEKAKTQTTA